MRRAILLAARNPAAQRTGRIAVLEAAVAGLRGAGFEVTVVALTKDETPSEWAGCELIRLQPGGVLATAGGVLVSALRGGTLNAGLFRQRSLIRRVREAADRIGADVVVGDGLRVWPLAAASRRPCIMHLDDLLSDRYGSAGFAEGNSNILGYFASQLPARLVGRLERLARASLGFESSRAYREEVRIARAADGVAMTSRAEAATLAQRAGATVDALPMAVDPRRPADPASAPAETAVFLGVLLYGPNIAALRHLRDAVLPEIERRGRRLAVDAVGAGAEEFAEEFAGTPIRLRGYAESLEEGLSGHRMFLSPVLAGTGVKTKVLDGMSVGLPVVATRLGVEGTDVEDGHEVLLGETPAEFADAVIRLMDSPELAARIGRAGRARLRDLMSSENVGAAWRAVLDRVVPPAQSPDATGETAQGKARA